MQMCTFRVQPKLKGAHLWLGWRSTMPMVISEEINLLRESATSKQLSRYRTHGKHTACLHREAGKGWMAHNSGTKICFCSRFSRLLRFVSSLLVGSDIPFRFTYLGVKKFNLALV